MGKGCKKIGIDYPRTSSRQINRERKGAPKSKTRQKITAKPIKTTDENTNEKEDVVGKTIDKHGVFGRRKSVVAYLASSAMVFMMIYLLYIAHVWRNLRHRALEAREPETCAPCKDLNSTDALTKEPHPDPASATCCGKASRVLQEMVAKFTEMKFREETRNRLTFPSFPGCNADLPPKPAARLSGISRGTQKDSETSPILWNTISYEVNGLKYLKGFIVVAEAGFYYVTFQITFDVISVTPGTIFRVQLHKTPGTSTEQEVLLESSKSSCEAEAEKAVVTVTAGSIFRFKEKERIFLSTTTPKYLHETEDSSFISVHKLQ